MTTDRAVVYRHALDLVSALADMAADSTTAEGVRLSAAAYIGDVLPVLDWAAGNHQ